MWKRKKEMISLVFHEQTATELHILHYLKIMENHLYKFNANDRDSSCHRQISKF